MKMDCEIAILGAGIAGLGAWKKCSELGRRAIIFEKNPTAGGLLDGFNVRGFHFDNAVHLSFANEPEVRAIFDKTQYITHPSDAFNFENDKWLKHPVQNNLYPLTPEEKTFLIASFINRPDFSELKNYEEWLRHQYGNAIAERYPIPYTKKYWQTDASQLSTSWIGNRMRRASPEEILFGAMSDITPNTYYTKEMRYPVAGGFKAFIKPLIDSSNIEYGTEVCSIDLDEKKLTFTNGLEVTFSTLISTLPLPLLISLCEGVPDDVRESAIALRATSIDLVSIGFNKIVTDKLWFYIYDQDIYASRAHSPSVKSAHNAPVGHSSLQFEIYNPNRTSKYSPEELIRNTMYALKKMNIANESDVLFMEHKHIPWGNVIFDLDMERNRDVVRDFVYKKNIRVCGRFGEWDYLWSNQSYLSGYSVI